MPTYSFICDSCEHRFERFLPITADNPDSCPECGADAVRRLPSAGAGFILKGAGFYATDNRSSEYKQAEKADKSNRTKDTAAACSTSCETCPLKNEA